MRKHSKIATISVAVFVGLLAVYFGGYQNGKSSNPSIDTEQAELVPQRAPVMAQSAQPQSGGDTHTQLAQIENLDPEDVDPASIDWEAMKQRYSIGRELNIDPMVVGFHGDQGYTAKEIAAFNKLHVVPFNPKVGEECGPSEPNYDRPNSVPFIRKCVDIFKYPKHPFESLPFSELTDLASTDAAAAVFASRRASEPKDRVAFALQAAALSEKSGPIIEVANRGFSSIFLPSDDGDVVSADNLMNRIVLEKVAEVLEDPRANPGDWLKHIDDLVETPRQRQELIEASEAATRQYLEFLIQAQREMTGSTHVWELVHG